MRKPLNDLPYNQRLQPTRACGPRERWLFTLTIAASPTENLRKSLATNATTEDEYQFARAELKALGG